MPDSNREIDYGAIARAISEAYRHESEYAESIWPNIYTSMSLTQSRHRGRRMEFDTVMEEPSVPPDTISVATQEFADSDYIEVPKRYTVKKVIKHVEKGK